MSSDNVDSILSQDLSHLNSYSDEHNKQLIEIIIQFIINSKVYFVFFIIFLFLFHFSSFLLFQGSDLQNKIGLFAESTR